MADNDFWTGLSPNVTQFAVQGTQEEVFNFVYEIALSDPSNNYWGESLSINSTAFVVTTEYMDEDIYPYDKMAAATIYSLSGPTSYEIKPPLKTKYKAFFLNEDYLFVVNDGSHTFSTYELATGDLYQTAGINPWHDPLVTEGYAVSAYFNANEVVLYTIPELDSSRISTPGNRYPRFISPTALGTAPGGFTSAYRVHNTATGGFLGNTAAPLTSNQGVWATSEFIYVQEYSILGGQQYFLRIYKAANLFIEAELTLPLGERVLAVSENLILVRGVGPVYDDYTATMLLLYDAKTLEPKGSMELPQGDQLGQISLALSDTHLVMRIERDPLQKIIQVYSLNVTQY